MSGGGSSAPAQTTTTTQMDPAISPYVTYGLSEAQKLYQSGGPSYYPGQTYVSPSATTEMGLQAATERALSGNALLPQAQQTFSQMQSQFNPATGLFGDIYSRAYTEPSTSFYTAAREGAFASPNAGAYGAIAQSPYTDPSTGLYTAVREGAFASPNMGAYGAIAQSPYTDPSAGFYGAAREGAFVNPAMAGTQTTAGGAYLGGNPFFQGAFQPAAQAATQSFLDAVGNLRSGAVQSGRYGSGAMADLENRAMGQLSTSLSNTAGNLAYQNYAAERAAQESALGRLGQLGSQDLASRFAGAQALGAAGQQGLQNQLAALGRMDILSAQDLAARLGGAQALGAAGQQGLQNQLAALGRLDVLSAQDLATRFGGAQALTAAQQQALANQMAAAGGVGQLTAADYARQLQAAAGSPALAEADYADIQKLLTVGQAQEQYSAQALQDAINRYNYQQNLPSAQLQQYLSAAYGSPMGGITTSMVPTYSSPYANLLGGATLGYALAPQGYSTQGALGGALLGGLLG